MILPETFTIRTKALFGDEFESFSEALEKEVPTSIRLNPNKPTTTSLFHEITSPEAEIPWASDAFYLSSRPSFTFDPLFHAGCYYVQEASSMFLEQVVKEYIKNPVKCLDLCAAPGGKSTHLSSLLPEGSLLVSNEIIRSRTHILAENLTKWGNPDTVVINNDPAEIGKLNAYFDVILTDVPCSGEGMFRKDKEAISHWSVANVNLCVERQRRIITDIWPALKPGGLLIYSTCTYNTEENEENIHWIAETFGAEILTIPVKDDWHIGSSRAHNYPAYRFAPHRTKGEGFFMALIQKPSETHRESSGQRKDKNKQKSGQVKKTFPNEINDWLNEPKQFYFDENNHLITAIREIHKQDYLILKERFACLHAGITIGEIKGKDIIPGHSLALSLNLNKKAFPTLEVDKETAIAYLRKEALLNLPSNTPRSYVLITFLGHPLGFVKNIGNRANNLYPQEWRIRKSIDH